MDLKLSISLEPARRSTGLALQWTDLQRRSDHSYFQSWAWIGTWLAELPATIDPLCLTARSNGTVVALGLFTPKRVVRHKLLRSKTLYLHETGRPLHDQLTIEHNGLLVDRRAPAEIVAACLDWLRRQTGLWDEIHFGGVNPRWEPWLAAPRLRLVRRHASPCPYVDLAELDPGAPLAHLGAETRHQIRRSRRLYGELALEVPSSLARAQAIWEELKALHQAAWTERGQPGAFANAFFTEFHERLIRERWPQGEIQILRVASEGATIGCLYNFLHEGRVSSYQSGFAFASDNRLKPGLVSHQAAMEYNHRIGMRWYDFLAGGARYKRSLSNRSDELLWLVVQRPKLAFRTEAFLRAGLRRLRAAF